MIWKPTKVQLEAIADMTTARMPLDRIVNALGIAPADFLAWRARVVAAAVAEELSCKETPMPTPQPPERRARMERVSESEPEQP